MRCREMMVRRSCKIHQVPNLRVPTAVPRLCCFSAASTGAGAPLRPPAAGYSRKDGLTGNGPLVVPTPRKRSAQRCEARRPIRRRLVGGLAGAPNAVRRGWAYHPFPWRASAARRPHEEPEASGIEPDGRDATRSPVAQPESLAAERRDVQTGCCRVAVVVSADSPSYAASHRRTR